MRNSHVPACPKRLDSADENMQDSIFSFVTYTKTRDNKESIFISKHWRPLMIA